MALWGGRFSGETRGEVAKFSESISFDQRLYKHDIAGSIAHVTMLAKQGVLTEEEKNVIIDGLNGILKDVEEGKLQITTEYEDKFSAKGNPIYFVRTAYRGE